MASEEGPKPSPTETTESTSHGSSVCDDDGDGDQEVIGLHADSSSDRQQQQQQQQQQTRFSFYDAQEVQSQFASSIPQSSMDSSENKNTYRYNFYDPAILPKNQSPIKVDIAYTKETKSTTARPISIGQTGASSSSSHHLQSQPLHNRQNMLTVESSMPRGISERRHPQINVQLPVPQQTLQDHNRTTSHSSLHTNSFHSHTEDILRSLQETEEQRMLILQSTTNLMDPPHVLASKAAAEAEASSKMTNAGADVHAESSVAAAIHTNSANLSASNNPYEDAIREALDLLRKHRSPPPSPSVNLLTGNPLGMFGLSGIPTQPESSNVNPRIDGTTLDRHQEHTILHTQEELLSRTTSTASTYTADNAPDLTTNDSLTDALQEAKLKAKQRQERMAEYAHRLQEFKSSLPPEQQPNSSHGQEQQPPKAPAHTANSSSTPQEQQASYGLPSESAASRKTNLLSPQLSHPMSPANDLDSIGLISDVSLPPKQVPLYGHYQQPVLYQHPETSLHQQRVVEEEVQKGVEKVLVAILQASRSTSSHTSALQGESAPDATSTQSAGTVSEVLLRAMDEVLHGKNTLSDDRSSVMTGASNLVEATPSTFLSKPSYSGSASHDARRMKKRSSVGGERSVVEELLAESDEETSVRYCPREEKKMTENERATSQNHCMTTIPLEKDIDALIEESLRASNGEESVEAVDFFSVDADEERDEELQSEYEVGESYEENDGEDDDEACKSPHTGVLGPLSRTAGGTTGVVLDTEPSSSPIQRNVSQGYISGVDKYRTSAPTPDRQRMINNQITRVGTQGSEDYDESSSHDIEAVELMRTLCAHLLPFGVDQAPIVEDVIPSWDEENPNEAGYRIIRLSKLQLRRVEQAFDRMINGLKNKSQSQLKGVESEYDANFIKELQEAERLLEDEEKRNCGGSVVKRDTISGRCHPDSRSMDVHLGSDCNDQQENMVEKNPHPDFPGIKNAGKGEIGDLEFFHLPIIFKSQVTGFEPTKDMVLEPGNVVAGQYLVEGEIGSAAFSTAYRCVDLSSDGTDGHEEVCLKVIKNTKDFFDQSLDEIKILELLRQTGKCDENYIIRMKTFFYYREHLIIVTELLRQNLFEFGKFIIDNEEEPYFTIPRLAFITRQCLVALRFVHNLGLVHSDIKPENILLGSYSRAKIKVIDFGSSCYLTDRQSSYIQSRSYRAPEVVLGLPYSGKIDVWSLGCVVAEMYTGEVTFQNDSIVSMLSRIEAICGSFPRHMIAQGRQSGRFFTKSGLLYEVVVESDNESGNHTPPGPNVDESESEADSQIHYDIFQPKNTTLSSRLGFDADLMDDYENNAYCCSGRLSEHELQQIFTDFVARLLTIDPDSRPTADEALQHPWMLYAATLTEEQIKYP
ncbi:serine/threonine kinase [Nitzschia inconspicua]|uniref:Serine/threonine kinase n=1 Tax=Nitzschia inconspicua TaxID=303405 RepID=A0A9K3LXA3_9STRA|nr:serine/threonine kinase [Nitzschia inconspicua]